MDVPTTWEEIKSLSKEIQGYPYFYDKAHESGVTEETEEIYETRKEKGRYEYFISNLATSFYG